MPSIHYKLVESSSRKEEDGKGGIMANSCPSCGDEQSSATTRTAGGGGIYFSICCQKKYCLSCQGTNAHHNECAAESIDNASDVNRLPVDHHSEQLLRNKTSFLSSFNTRNTTTDFSSTSSSKNRKSLYHELYGSNTSNQFYNLCQEIPSKNKTHMNNKDVMISIAASPFSKPVRGLKENVINISPICRKANKEIIEKEKEEKDIEFISTSQDQTMQTKFIFPNTSYCPLEYIPDHLVNYMTAENFHGIPEVVISSTLFRKFYENKWLDKRVEYNGDDQDFLHNFQQYFPYGTIVSSVDHALNQLNMLGCSYRFKLRRESNFIRCCKQLSCKFKVNFVHIFRVEKQRYVTREKYLKGLDNHPIMITKAKLNHNHPI